MIPHDSDLKAACIFADKHKGYMDARMDDASEYALACAFAQHREAVVREAEKGNAFDLAHIEAAVETLERRLAACVHQDEWRDCTGTISGCVERIKQRLEGATQ